MSASTSHVRAERTLRSRVGGIGRVGVSAVSMVLIVMVGVVIGALAAGYRPIVLTTGSMTPTAPTGSLIIAAPRQADQVATGDILVMRRMGYSTITHRVVEIERHASNRFAITRGDANETPDPAPYSLDGEQLVTRWVVPGAGRRLVQVASPGPAMGLMTFAVLIIAIQLLRAIWRRADDEPVVEIAEAPERMVERIRRRRRAMAIVPLTLASTAGVTFALFTRQADVTANAFSTSECFDPQLASVQSGQTTHAIDGTSSIAITPVDPTSSFVLASARSASNEPADSSVTVVLAGAGSTVDIARDTDDPTPDPVIVAWSVVEYSCGVSVQRGTVAGNGTDRIDVTVTSVDPTASFALVSSASARTDAAFDGNDLFTAGLTGPTTLTIRGATGVTFDPGRSFAWEIVTFDDPTDIDVQTVTGVLGVGTSTTTLAVPTPTDLSTTFLLTGVMSTSSGADIGERLVRAHLVDANTIEITRAVGGDALSVSVQVVTLRDGTTVQHGTVDLGSGFPVGTVAIEPIDTTRSTATSTVAVPGVLAGGSTDHVVDDVVGEATATFVLTDPQTLSVERSATASAASFGWQVIEWAGPGWWDDAYEFRQRIDVDTAAVAAPDGYSLPLTFDHAALAGLELAETDGSDLRVVRWDGTTWTELDRVLGDDATWNTSNTTLWFRTVDPIAAASTATYWLYFGNPVAGAPPANPEAVFLLVENFDSGTLGDFEDRTAGSGWYAADPWSRRIPITIASGKVGSDLTDFPALVSITSADLAANAQADGSDIRFTAADGTTPRAHEIERWDPATGSLVAWVRMPTVTAASATSAYLYYGAANAPDQQSVRSVWPDEIEAAWHLARDPSGSAPQIDDSSGRRHDGLSAGAMNGADLVAGIVGDAIDFDGSDDVAQVDSFDLGGSTALTVSAWVRLDTTTTDGRIVTKSDNDATTVFDLAVASNGAVRARLVAGGTMRTATTAAGAVSTGTWHHVAFTWDGIDLRVLVNAAGAATAPATGALVRGPTMPVTIGNLLDGSKPIDGRVDEIRVETVARSDHWLAAAESNQRSPGAFASFGAPQSGTWFGQGSWSTRKPIVVDASLVDATVADFALLVDITDVELGAVARPDAADVVFTARDGVTRLDHVVESFDSGTGGLTSWVRIPTLSAAENTEIFLYFGNNSADDQSDPERVFGSDADLVLLGSP